MAKRNRREAILSASEKLFTARRFHEVCLDDVVRSARVGKGTIYRYFADKDDLFFHTATRGFDELCDLLEGNARTRATFEARLKLACRQVQEFFVSHNPPFRLMNPDAHIYWHRPEIRKRWHEKRGRLLSVVAGILRDGQSAGRLRADVPVEMQAVFLLGMIRTAHHELPTQHRDGGAVGLLVDMFLRGVQDAGCSQCSPKAGRAGRRRSRK